MKNTPFLIYLLVMMANISQAQVPNCTSIYGNYGIYELTPQKNGQLNMIIADGYTGMGGGTTETYAIFGTYASSKVSIQKASLEFIAPNNLKPNAGYISGQKTTSNVISQVVFMDSISLLHQATPYFFAYLSDTGGVHWFKQTNYIRPIKMISDYQDNLILLSQADTLYKYTKDNVLLWKVKLSPPVESINVDDQNNVIVNGGGSSFQHTYSYISKLNGTNASVIYHKNLPNMGTHNLYLHSNNVYYQDNTNIYKLDSVGNAILTIQHSNVRKIIIDNEQRICVYNNPMGVYKYSPTGALVRTYLDANDMDTQGNVYKGYSLDYSLQYTNGTFTPIKLCKYDTAYNCVGCASVSSMTNYHQPQPLHGRLNSFIYSDDRAYLNITAYTGGAVNSLRRNVAQVNCYNPNVQPALPIANYSIDTIASCQYKFNDSSINAVPPTTWLPMTMPGFVLVSSGIVPHGISLPIFNGNYQLGMVAYNEFGLDTVVKTLTLNNSYLPTKFQLIKSGDCAAQTIKLKLPPGYNNFRWSNGSQTDSITITYPDTTTYTALKAFYANCTVQESYPVKANWVLPTVNLTLNGGYLFASYPALYNRWYHNNVLIATGIDSLLPTLRGDYFVIVTDSLTGCIVQSNTINYSPIGTNDTQNTTSYIVPNPSNGKFFVRTNADFIEHLTIYDTKGTQVYYQKNYNTKQYIDVTHLPKGIYTLQLMATKKQRITTQKLILN